MASMAGLKNAIFLYNDSKAIDYRFQMQFLKAVLNFLAIIVLTIWIYKYIKWIKLQNIYLIYIII